VLRPELLIIVSPDDVEEDSAVVDDCVKPSWTVAGGGDGGHDIRDAVGRYHQLDSRPAVTGHRVHQLSHRRPCLAE